MSSLDDSSDRTDKIKFSRYPGGSQAHPGLGFGPSMMPNTCPQRGVVWFMNKIVDTGTPQGGMAYNGAPASFINMNQLYNQYNLVLEKGNATLYPARNGMATGTGMQLLSCPNGPDVPAGIAMGAGGPGSSPSQLGCPGGNRTFRLGFGGQNIIATIDTGTPAFPVTNGMMQRMGMQRMMGSRGTFMMMATFEPNPNPSPLVCINYNNPNSHFCPAYWISQAVRVILTNQFTILQSLAMDGTSIYYSCQGGQRQMGDPLQGRWKM